MSEIKRVKVVMPKNGYYFDEIAKAEILRQYNGKIISIRPFSDEESIFLEAERETRIPIEWLREVKEPMSFDEWLNGKNTGLNGDAEDAQGLAQDAWDACLENEKLRRQQ